MESLRDNLRFQMTEERFQRRSLLQDSTRHLDGKLQVNIQTEAEMENSAKLLTQKSAITSELLVAIKNGLLQSMNNIEAFMKVEAALPALLRLFSVPGIDARLQLLAGHCLCNLALGDVKVCRRLFKLGGSYFVMRLDGMNQLLTEASVWAIGNMSAHGEIARQFYEQGIYHRVTKLVNNTVDESVCYASAYCLIHALKNNPELFSNEDYIEIASNCLSLGKFDPIITLLCSMLAHKPEIWPLMMERNLHIHVIQQLNGISLDEKDLSLPLSLIRIIGNLICEPSGQVGRQLLSSASFPNCMQRLVKAQQPSIQKESIWIISNMISHNDTLVKNLSLEKGLLELCSDLI